MSIPEFLLDKRVVERNIANGLITRSEVQKKLGALADAETNSELCVLQGNAANNEAPTES